MSRVGEKVQIDVKYVPKNSLSKELQELGIKHRLIKPHTPKQNGKVVCLTNLQ